MRRARRWPSSRRPALRDARRPRREPPAARDAARAALRDATTAIPWSRLLDEAGVPNEIAIDTKAGERVLFDGDNERLGLVAEYEHPILGRMRQFGSLIDFSETPGQIHGPPPMVGEHTVEILEWLGYTRAEREELKADGVIYWPDDNYAWTS